MKLFIKQWLCVIIIGMTRLLCFCQNTENQIIFSQPSGFYDWNFVLELHAENGDCLRYTLDGSLPTPTSRVCEGRLPMTILTYLPDSLMFIQTSPGINHPQTDNVKANVLRVASFSGQKQTSKVYNGTYFVGVKKEIEYPRVPIISIITDPNNFFNSDTGIYVTGNSFTGPNDGNYFQKGKEWERLAHLQFFDSLGVLGFEQDVGIRIQGKNRRTPQKSLRICAREKYGSDHINYPIFGSHSDSSFNKLVLRNSFGCWQKTLFKDQLTSFICRNMDFEVMEGIPCIVFIDGEYWGIHAIRTYFDDDYIAQKYKSAKDSVNIASHTYGFSVDKTATWGLEEGDASSLIALYSYLKSANLADKSSYQQIYKWLDIKSIIDYYCAEIFFNNRDWPENNNVLWSVGAKGQWRQVFMDLDAGWINPESNTLQSLLTIPANYQIPRSHFLIYTLMQSPFFRQSFANRMACLLENEFSTENLITSIDVYDKLYFPLMERHTKRWGSPGTISQWKAKINILRSFARTRPKQIKRDFATRFDQNFNPIDCR